MDGWVWWAVGIAGWYVSAAVGIRMIPREYLRGTTAEWGGDATAEYIMVGALWAASPALFPLVALCAIFAAAGRFLVRKPKGGA